MHIIQLPYLSSHSLARLSSRVYTSLTRLCA